MTCIECRKKPKPRPETQPDGYIETDLAVVSYSEYSSYLARWIDTPFVHMGRNGLGVDCIGLALCIYNGLGLADVWTESHYAYDWYLHQSTHKVFEEFKEKVNIRWINDGRYIPGDIMIYSMGRAAEAHVALYDVDNTVVHAVAKPIGRVIRSRPDEGRYLKKLKGAYRVVK